MCEHADLRFHDGVQVKYCASLVTNLKSRFTDLPIVSCFALVLQIPITVKVKLEILCIHYKLDLMSCKQECGWGLKK